MVEYLLSGSPQPDAGLIFLACPPHRRLVDCTVARIRSGRVIPSSPSPPLRLAPPCIAFPRCWRRSPQKAAAAAVTVPDWLCEAASARRSSDARRKHLADLGGVSCSLFLIGRTLTSWTLWKLAILDFSRISQITVRIEHVWVTAIQQAVDYRRSLVLASFQQQTVTW